MKTISTVRVLGLAGLSILTAAPALAQDTSHYYGGVSVGQSKTDMNAPGITAGLLPGVTALSTTSDEKDTAYKLFGGYQFNRHFAVEGGYFNLGKSSFTANTFPAGTLAGETKVHGLNLDLVGTLPLTERLSAQARIGAQHAWSRHNFSGTGAAAAAAGSNKRNDGNLKVGLGMQYEMTPSVWVRADVERYRIKDAVGQRNNVTVASLSLVFPFGRAAPVRMAAAPESPVYVAPAPQPEPVVIAAPPPAPAPVRQRVSLSADTLFGFDKATVQPNTELDNFKNQVAGTRVEAITVEGHTDRIGSTEYNQNLSVERADAVKSYLVTQGEQDPSKITAVG
ncbi:MAG TPA: outer membrane beta-barrel protein, partial [Macromonas sp.]|nr:outer membrane beta-barrel protein [Macromonas sp.]